MNNEKEINNSAYNYGFSYVENFMYNNNEEILQNSDQTILIVTENRLLNPKIICIKKDIFASIVRK